MLYSQELCTPEYISVAKCRKMHHKKIKFRINTCLKAIYPSAGQTIEYCYFILISLGTSHLQGQFI
jgi:hypothetical protein